MLSVQDFNNFDIDCYKGKTQKNIQKAFNYILTNNLNINSVEFNAQSCYFEWVCQTCQKKDVVTAFNLLNKGVCCLDCYRKEKSNAILEEKISKIKQLGFKICSISKNKNFKNTVWKIVCPKGHVFEKSGKRITKNFNEQNTMNCPCCWIPSMEEERVRLLLEHHFNNKFPNVHPEWLINPLTQVPMELDMYCEELKLAVEYNGIHHYEPIFGEDKLNGTMEKDSLKKEICSKFGVKLIVIDSSPKKESLRSKVLKWEKQLNDYGVKLSRETIDFAINKKLDVGNRQTTEAVEKVNEKLNKFGLSWVDGEFENKLSTLTVMFKKCGHKLKKEVRKIRSMTEKNHFKCSTCCRLEQQISAAKLMCVQKGFVFEKLSFENASVKVNGFYAKDGKSNVKVSDYLFSKFKKENGIVITKS